MAKSGWQQSPRKWHTEHLMAAVKRKQDKDPEAHFRQCICSLQRTIPVSQSFTQELDPNTRQYLQGFSGCIFPSQWFLGSLLTQPTQLLLLLHSTESASLLGTVPLLPSHKLKAQRKKWQQRRREDVTSHEEQFQGLSPTPENQPMFTQTRQKKKPKAPGTGSKNSTWKHG